MRFEMVLSPSSHNFSGWAQKLELNQQRSSSLLLWPMDRVLEGIGGHIYHGVIGFDITNNFAEALDEKK